LRPYVPRSDCGTLRMPRWFEVATRLALKELLSHE
jgi:hypothetical protein